MDKNDYFIFNPWWEKKKLETGILRSLYLEKIDKRLTRKQIEILTGSRRVGKTTILKQIVNLLLRHKIPRKIFFMFLVTTPGQLVCP